MQSKICFFFAWEASCGKILTLDQLKRRGMTFANKCFLCQEKEETVELFSFIAQRQECFGSFFSFFDVSWVISSPVKDTLLGWRGSFVTKDRRRARIASPLCLFWAVWKIRNDIVFKNESFLYKSSNIFLYIFFGQRPNCFLFYRSGGD